MGDEQGLCWLILVDYVACLLMERYNLHRVQKVWKTCVWTMNPGTTTTNQCLKTEWCITWAPVSHKLLQPVWRKMCSQFPTPFRNRHLQPASQIPMEDGTILNGYSSWPLSLITSQWSPQEHDKWTSHWWALVISLREFNSDFPSMHSMHPYRLGEIWYISIQDWKHPRHVKLSVSLCLSFFKKIIYISLISGKYQQNIHNFNWNIEWFGPKIFKNWSDWDLNL